MNLTGFYNLGEAALVRGCTVLGLHAELNGFVARSHENLELLDQKMT